MVIFAFHRNELILFVFRVLIHRLLIGDLLCRIAAIGCVAYRAALRYFLVAERQAPKLQNSAVSTKVRFETELGLL